MPVAGAQSDACWLRRRPPQPWERVQAHSAASGGPAAGWAAHQQPRAVSVASSLSNSDVAGAPPEARSSACAASQGGAHSLIAAACGCKCAWNRSQRRCFSVAQPLGRGPRQRQACRSWAALPWCPSGLSAPSSLLCSWRWRRGRSAAARPLGAAAGAAGIGAPAAPASRQHHPAPAAAGVILRPRHISPPPDVPDDILRHTCTARLSLQ